ncbi:MAG TPA: hypothetical protein VHI98_00595 [Vicinamibacterales bacterium]|jgi:hypothetical protein|nr:hypothetical protein [Vicinamibacterales bacterium]
MSDAAGGLQFDQADYAQAPAEMVCAQCKRAITTSYYLAGDSALCGLCRNDLERARTSGTRYSRFARAFGAGTVAAFLGFLLYYGIAALTGYEFGLIAIVVGFAVGSAVRWGSNGRGGWRYQVMAVVLTYLAIVGTYVPPIVEAIREQETAAGVIESSEDPAVVQIAAEPDTIGAAAAGEAGIVRFVVGVIFLMALACAAPFLSGAENIIGLIILGIGLFEAWKLTKRTELTVTGPHAVWKPPAAAQAAAV